MKLALTHHAARCASNLVLRLARHSSVSSVAGKIILKDNAEKLLGHWKLAETEDKNKYQAQVSLQSYISIRQLFLSSSIPTSLSDGL